MIPISEIEKEFNSLEVLSYERIIEILNNQKNQTVIWFSDYRDSNGKEYHYVQVRDIDNDKHTIYKAPDQNDESIDENLHKALEKSPVGVQYGYYEDEWCTTYMCMIGKNRLDFPDSIAKRVIAEFRETDKKQSKSKKLTLNINDGELPFEI